MSNVSFRPAAVSGFLVMLKANPRSADCVPISSGRKEIKNARIFHLFSGEQNCTRLHPGDNDQPVVKAITLEVKAGHRRGVHLDVPGSCLNKENLLDERPSK
jgi:hypothetical protein